MQKYVTFEALYEKVLCSIQIDDYLLFCETLSYLVHPLSFYGYLTVKQARSFCFFINESTNRNQKYAIIRRLYHCLSKEYEYDNQKMVEKTKLLMSHFKHKGYWSNRVTEEIFDIYKDNCLLVTDNPRRYYLIEKKTNCLEYLGKYVRIYDWKFKLLSKYRLQGKDEAGYEYLENNRLYICNATKNTISVMDPYTLQPEIVDHIKIPKRSANLYENHDYIYYSYFDEFHVVYRMNKETNLASRFAELSDSVVVEFFDNCLLVHYRVKLHHHYRDKLPTVRPEVYNYAGKLIRDDYRLNGYLIKLIIRTCFYDDPVTLGYLIDEEISRFTNTEKWISIRYLREMINRFSDLKLDNEEPVESLKKVLTLLEECGLNPEDDINKTLLSLMDCIRYPLIDGNHPSQLFSERFYDCFRAIIGESGKSREELKDILTTRPDEIFRDYYRWTAEEKELIHFYNIIGDRL